MTLSKLSTQSLILSLSLVLAASQTRAEDPPPSIHRAVRDDNTLALRQWLAKDIALINARDADGMTPLHLAVAKNKKRAFEFLIASGANVHLATGLTSSMKIDREDGAFAFREPRAQWTALHLAAFANRLEMSRVLISKGARVGIRNDFGETPLYLASKEGHVGMIRLLLSHSADINETPKKGGFTPLMAAAFNGHNEAGQMLVANGATLDVLSAAALGFAPDVDTAISKNPAIINGDGTAAKSPLYWAAANGQFRIVQILLVKDANTEVKDEGIAPLMMASIIGHNGVVRALLDKKANIDEWDRHGWTALHHAAINNQPRIARTLLARKANAAAKDLRGRTTVDWRKKRATSM
ncbi:MAG: ankyrin repeat domain-containing protein [Planctomycetes bacterium]|nr:ankyrin repeat domain-containing protein [Planctomycetota bacterium]